MTDPAHEHAAKAAKLIAQRDLLQTRIRKLDVELQKHTSAYSRAVRTWGFTPSMMRHACEARGLLPRNDI